MNNCNSEQKLQEGAPPFQSARRDILTRRKRQCYAGVFYIPKAAVKSASMQTIPTPVPYSVLYTSIFLLTYFDLYDIIREDQGT